MTMLSASGSASASGPDSRSGDSGDSGGLAAPVLVGDADEFWQLVDAGLVDRPWDAPMPGVDGMCGDTSCDVACDGAVSIGAVCDGAGRDGLVFGGAVFDDSVSCGALFCNAVSVGAVPPEPAWVAAAEAERDRADLLVAADGPAGLDAAHVLAALNPEALAAAAFRVHEPDQADTSVVSDAVAAAAGLVAGVKAARRLVNHYQALEQRWIAALARPGVAVPLADAVDMCLTGSGKDHRIPIATELPDDLPVEADGRVDMSPLLHLPAWSAALGDVAIKLASAEVSCALHIAPITARVRTEKALGMVEDLPATLAAQQRGDVDSYRASIIADRTAVLDHATRRVVERAVLPYANARTPGVVRDLVDREVIAADPTAAERRVKQAKKRRAVTTYKDDDGMSVLRGLVAAEDASMIYGVLDDIATSVHAAGSADGRGRSQIRADAFVDLFGTLAHTGHAHIASRSTAQPHHTADAPDPGQSRGPAQPPVADIASTRPFSGIEPCPGHRAAGAPAFHSTCCEAQLPHQPVGLPGQTAGYGTAVGLNVYIHASTLAGLDDLPGELAGYGTITAASARALAASANTVRSLVISEVRSSEVHSSDARSFAKTDGGREPAVIYDGQGHSTNPVRSRGCDAIVGAGRAVYRPPDATADNVTARDRTCQFPGCRTSAQRCDIDHRLAFEAGGATCACNLDVLCRFHHRLKTFTPWRAEPAADGRLTWTSPTGQRQLTEPGHILRDHLLPHDAADNEPPPY